MKVQNCQIWRSGTEGLKYYSVRGTALLWISEKYHDIIEPLATSHNYKETLQEKFFDQGTDEMTNFFVIEEALKYYEQIGGMKFLHENARNLLEGLREKLCRELGCSMYPVPSSMQAPYMKIVKLPESVRYLKVMLLNLYLNRSVPSAPNWRVLAFEQTLR